MANRQFLLDALRRVRLKSQIIRDLHVKKRVAEGLTHANRYECNRRLKLAANHLTRAARTRRSFAIPLSRAYRARRAASSSELRML